MVNNVTVKDMCPPAVQYELDFEDYITFLSYGASVTIEQAMLHLHAHLFVRACRDLV